MARLGSERKQREGERGKEKGEDRERGERLRWWWWWPECGGSATAGR